MTRKILVVEDEEELKKILEIKLEYAGFEVTCASGGHEALDSLKSEEYDCIVTDYMMRKGLGIVVVEYAIDHNIPVILSTAYAKEWNQKRQLDVTILHKPYNLQSLIETIEIEIAKKSSLREKG